MKDPANKRRSKTVAAISVTLAVIIAALSIPHIYFVSLDAAMLRAVHARKWPEGRSPEAEDLYLVRTIHELYKPREKGAVTPSLTVNEMSDMAKEFSQQVKIMRQSGIISEGAAGFLNADGLYSLQILENDRYVMPVSRIWLVLEEAASGAFADYYLDETAGKILYFMMYINEESQLMEVDRQAARKYIAYLGLDVLDDWEESATGLISKRAGLTVTCLTSEYRMILRIQTASSEE